MSKNQSQFIRASEAYRLVQQLYEINVEWGARNALLRRLASGALKSIATGAYKFTVITRIWGKEFDSPHHSETKIIPLNDGVIPEEFWHEFYHSHDPDCDWGIGDFSFNSVDAHGHVHGVMFDAAGISALIGTPSVQPTSRISTDQMEVGPARGRKAANWWPDFAAELAVYIHENGVPESQESLISGIQTAMSEAGKDEPSRTQIQPVIRAVLRRLQAAGNTE